MGLFEKIRALPLFKGSINFEVMRISRYSRTRKVGQGSSEHDLLGEFIMILVT